MRSDDLVFIERNKDGNWYVGFRVKVQRGIKGKTKSKVDEIIIVGINNDYFDQFCCAMGLKVRCVNSANGEKEYYGY